VGDLPNIAAGRTTTEHDCARPVLCVGAVTFDTIFRVARVPADDERVVAERAVSRCGGPAATAAATLARLGVPVALAARVGADAAGNVVLEQLEAMGVDTQLVVRDPGAATAISAILLDQQSHGRRIVTSPPLTWQGHLGPPEALSGG
jgi:sulfofructose kinase